MFLEYLQCHSPMLFMLLSGLRVFEDVIYEYLDYFVIVFMDEILIYTKTKEEHERHLRMTLQVLREHHLYAKLENLSFG